MEQGIALTPFIIEERRQIAWSRPPLLGAGQRVCSVRPFLLLKGNSLATKAQEQLQQLLTIMASLRDPEKGCPWDLEQDFVSIAGARDSSHFKLTAR